MHAPLRSTIRGVSNPEKLLLTISDKGTSSGELHGAMVFNRKDYGMNKGIPFIKHYCNFLASHSLSLET
jgi:polyisoprenoid-binding protein YceI